MDQRNQYFKGKELHIVDEYYVNILESYYSWPLSKYLSIDRMGTKLK